MATIGSGLLVLVLLALLQAAPQVLRSGFVQGSVIDATTGQPLSFHLFTRLLCTTGLPLCSVRPAACPDIHFALPVLNATDQLELAPAFPNPTAVTLTLTARNYTGSMIAGLSQ